MAQVAFLEAHDAEVLCLEFTRPASGNVAVVLTHMSTGLK